MKLKELIEMYEAELKALLSTHKVSEVRGITHIVDRTEAAAIHRFLYNLKNIIEP